MHTRNFEKITKYQNVEIPMPTRKTPMSAGYDIACAKQVTILPGETAFVETGLKCYMLPGEVLELHIRSSSATKRKLRLVNCTGIIDGDYYNNPDNEGHILGCVENFGKEPQVIHKDDVILQGLFLKHLVTDTDDKAQMIEFDHNTGNYVATQHARKGGFGSTDSAPKD